MLSQSGVYALQATLLLAQHPPETSVSAAEMARRLEVPPKYLAKVLQRMSREGFLASTRGSRGGYRLTVSPAELSVEQVVAPFDEYRAPKVCLLGGPCDEEAPCTAHQHRVRWTGARRRLLTNTMISDLLHHPAPSETTS